MNSFTAPFFTSECQVCYCSSRMGDLLKLTGLCWKTRIVYFY